MDKTAQLLHEVFDNVPNAPTDKHRKHKSALAPSYAQSDCHTQCHDCGQFLKKHLWVPKDHRWKKHALCLDCLSNYDDPEIY